MLVLDTSPGDTRTLAAMNRVRAHIDRSSGCSIAATFARANVTGTTSTTFTRTVPARF